MSKEWARRFYKSKAWGDARSYVIDRDRGECQRCKRMGRIEPGAIVHHIEPLTPANIGDPRISLNPDNLELVCKECHERIHDELGEGSLHRGARAEAPRVGFDAWGNVVRL